LWQYNSLVTKIVTKAIPREWLFSLAPMACYRPIADTADRRDLHIYPSSFNRQNKKQPLDSLNLGVRVSILILAGLAHVDKL
jgi:hypothetical protein